MKTCQDCINKIVARAFKWGREDAGIERAAEIRRFYEATKLAGPESTEEGILLHGFAQGYLEALRDHKAAARKLIDNETFESVVGFLQDSIKNLHACNNHQREVLDHSQARVRQLLARTEQLEETLSWVGRMVYPATQQEGGSWAINVQDRIQEVLVGQ